MRKGIFFKTDTEDPRPKAVIENVQYQETLNSFYLFATSKKFLDNSNHEAHLPRLFGAPSYSCQFLTFTPLSDQKDWGRWSFIMCQVRIAQGQTSQDWARLIQLQRQVVDILEMIH